MTQPPRPVCSDLRTIATASDSLTQSIGKPEIAIRRRAGEDSSTRRVSLSPRTVLLVPGPAESERGPWPPLEVGGAIVTRAEPTEKQPLETGEIRRRALAGVAILGGRGLLLRLFGLGANVVLARLLVPEDFGLVAFGHALMVFVRFFADAGLGAALVRRPEAPHRTELQALFGFQLVATGLLAAATAAIAWPFGDSGKVTALIVIALPVAVMRTPGAIVLERELSYRSLFRVEVLENAAFHAWAIATVAVGWGVWGLASAALARALVGSSVMLWIAPIGILRPRFSWSHLRALLAFGARYQAVGVVNLARDQGLNVGTAAIAGVGTLGLWSLANRVLHVPYLLFESLWRVSFPAMSRLIAAGEEAKPMIERTLSLAVVGTGCLLTPLVASAPVSIPAVFGGRWSEAAEVFPWAGLGLMIGIPISVATAGYLYAVGDTSTVLRSTVLHTLGWAAVTFVLLPLFGISALGLGWLAAGLIEGGVLGRAAAKRTGARLASLLAPPAALAVGAAGTGWWVAHSMEPSLAAAGLVAVVTEVLFLSGLLLTRRRLLGDTVSTARRALRASIAPGG